MKNIIILGGGTAGWLTAIFIKQTYPDNNVTVIEDPDTPPIIAGESGSANLNKFYNYLGLSMDDFIKRSNAMPKLGGWFRDWNGPGTEFIHGLIPDWYSLDWRAKFPEISQANDFISCSVAEDIRLENIFYNSQLQRLGKLPISAPIKQNELFYVHTLPMWHFDSRGNAAFLKEEGLKQGINLIEGKFTHAERSDLGNITKLFLKDGRDINGDWFFDCSGFARLLMHKVIGEPLEDNSNYFPARSVVAWWEDDIKVINYTDIRAMKYGWRWNINLNHRSGNGYIYDPDLISVDQAVEEIETAIGHTIDPVAKLKFNPEIMKNTWRHNVIAVGLSNGFLEPLESNGLVSVAAQLETLSDFWCPESLSVDSVEHRHFNDKFYKIMTSVRDFLSLHYRGSREDTEFWRSHRYDKNRIPATLQTRLDMWEEVIVGVDN
jgi:tryptophan halogenase